MKMIISTYYLDPKEVNRKAKPIVQDVVASASRFGVYTENIKTVFLTDDIKETMHRLSRKHGIPSTLTDEKEYVASAKIVTIPQGKDAGDAIIALALVDKPVLLREILLFLIMRTYYEKMDKKRIAEEEIPEDMPLSRFVRSRAGEWIAMIRTVKKMREHEDNIELYDDSMESYTQAFMRGMKRAHWAYQKTIDHGALYSSSVNYTVDYLSRCLEAFLRGTECIGLMQYQELIEAFIAEISGESDALENGGKCDTARIDQIVHDILILSGIRIDLDSQNGIWIEENPKYLFRDVFKETEQRIVAVVDILGFREKLNSYDANKYSTLLRDITVALEQAVQVTIEIMKSQNDEYEKLLDYRMYSDNLCLSLPYYDTDADFLSQLSILLTIIRLYQSVLMQSNIMVRGGMTIGSYYSDKNTIFSSALVDAHEIEKSTGMPRVALSRELVERINESEEATLKMLNIQDVLLYDKYDNAVFVNPFGMKKMILGGLDRLSEAYREHVLSPLEEGGSRYADLMRIPVDLLSHFRKVAQMSYERFDYDGKIKEVLLSELERLRKENNSNAGTRDAVLEKYMWMYKLQLWSSGEEVGDSRFVFYYEPLIEENQ